MGRLDKSLLVNCILLLGACSHLNGVSIQSVKPSAFIRHIAVTGDDDNLAVEIRATTASTPLIQFVTNPDRLIVDFQEVLPGAGLRKVFVNRGNLADVRIGVLSVNPRVARVVLDLTSPTPFRVDTSGSMTVIKLGGVSPPAPNPPPTATSRPLIETEAADNGPAFASLVPESPLPQRNPAHLILPILTVLSVLTMLVIALVNHIHNKQNSRGL